MSVMNYSYFLNQLLTIFAIYVAGLVFVYLLSFGKEHREDKGRLFMEIFLAFPAGLSIWGVGGFLILVLGLPYNVVTVLALYFIAFGIVTVRADRGGTISFKKLLPSKENGKTVLFVLLLVIIIAAICCSGTIPVAISNDSYYYYSVYPQSIVEFGRYMSSFDVFLTDVGQTTALINTLPWMFGFEETFGIQLFLCVNFVAIFYYVVKKNTGKKMYAVASTVILICSSPFLATSDWILANAYFMIYLFIMFALAMKIIKAERNKTELILLTLFSAMLSMMRMEGGMIVCLLILCVASAETIKSRDIVLYMLLPVFITQVLYYLTIYLSLSVNPLYSFLDMKNAAIMIGLILVIAFYLAVIRDREKFAPILKYYSVLLLLILVLGNACLMVVDFEKYTGNIKSFILNIYLKNGWGYFGYFVGVMALIILAMNVYSFIRDKRIKQLSFSMLFLLAFGLFIIAVCWARDGALRVGIGDSGNRVLMQITPFVIYSFTAEIYSFFE